MNEEETKREREESDRLIDVIVGGGGLLFYAFVTLILILSPAIKNYEVRVTKTFASNESASNTVIYHPAGNRFSYLTIWRDR